VSERFLGISGLVALAWAAAAAPATMVGCGDDGGGNGDPASIGESLVESRQAFAVAACGCFSELSEPYDTQGACIADLDVSPAAGACFADRVDEIDGAEAALRCERDARQAFVACVEQDTCSGAGACETAFSSTLNDDCPRPSGAAESALAAAAAECLGDDGGNNGGGDGQPDGVGACPQRVSTANIGDTISGSTADLGDDYEIQAGDVEGCPGAGAGAPDDTIRFTAPAAGEFVLSLDAGATTFPAIIYTTSDGMCPAASGRVVPGVCSTRGGTTSIVLTAPAANAVATIIVDGLSEGDAGDYTILVTESGGDGGMPGGDDDDDDDFPPPFP
jgi:hypothetical protein